MPNENEVVPIQEGLTPLDRNTRPFKPPIAATRALSASTDEKNTLMPDVAIGTSSSGSNDVDAQSHQVQASAAETRRNESHNDWPLAAQNIRRFSLEIESTDGQDTDLEDPSILEMNRQIKNQNPNKLLVYNITVPKTAPVSSATDVIIELFALAMIDGRLLLVDPVYPLDDSVFITPINGANFPCLPSKYMNAVKNCLSKSLKVIWAPSLDKDVLRMVSINTKQIQDCTLIDKIKDSVAEKLAERDVPVIKLWCPPNGERILVYCYRREDMSDYSKMAPIVVEGRTLTLTPPNMKAIILPCAPYHLIICVPRGRINKVGVSLKKYMESSFVGIRKIWFDRLNDRIHISMDTIENATILQDDWAYNLSTDVPFNLRNTELVGPHFVAHYNALPWTAKRFENDSTYGNANSYVSLCEVADACESIRRALEDYKIASQQMVRDSSLEMISNFQRLLDEHYSVLENRLKILEEQGAANLAVITEILNRLQNIFNNLSIN